MSEQLTTTNDGAELCWQAFGVAADPAVLLIAGGGESMDFWEDGFCAMLAAAGRYVLRYDHRDTGRSSTSPPGKPEYGAAELVTDAVAVLDAAGVACAHVVGLSLGASLAWTLADRHPERVRTLTLCSTTPPGVADLPGMSPELAVAYGLVDGDDADGHGDDVAGADGGPGGDGGDAPDGVIAVGQTTGTASDTGTDTADDADPVAGLVADLRRHTGSRPFDEPRMTAVARRAVERSSDPSAGGNHFIVADQLPPVALESITVPTLVLHGTADPLFPYAHGAALAAAVPRARLVALPGVGHEHAPPALWPRVVAELLDHTAPDGSSTDWEPASDAGPTTSTGHRIGTAAQWRAERLALLGQEKELTRRTDVVSARRAALPWVPVTEDHRFDTEDGPAGLGELFAGRTQLIAYHLMHPGCPSCSAVIDGLDGVAAHLQGHDVAVVVTCRVSLAELTAYRDRLGWTLPVASHPSGSLHRANGLLYTEEERAAGIEHGFRHYPAEFATRFPPDAPGMSAYARDGDAIFRTYTAHTRGLDVLNSALQWLDRAPLGRNHAPDPDWLKLRDAYPSR